MSKKSASVPVVFKEKALHKLLVCYNYRKGGVEWIKQK